MSNAVAVDESLFEGSAETPVPRIKGIYVRFYMEAVENSLKSDGGIIHDKDGKETYVEGAGRPIYDDVEFIEKIVPGDKTNIVQRPVTTADKKEFVAQYRAWKAGEIEQTSGTPLGSLPGIKKSQVEELAYFKIRTIEQLAEVSDGNLQNIGPYLALRTRAQDYLEAAAGAAPAAAARAALAQRENENEVLKRQLAALQEQVNQLAKAKK